MFARRFEDEKYDDVALPYQTTVRRHALRNVEVTDSRFDHVHLAPPWPPVWPWKGRHEFVGVTLQRCTFTGCSLSNALLKRVTFDECVGKEELILDDCLLEQVVFRGKCSSLRIIPGPSETGTAPRPFSDFYAKVDYAIDVREGQFREIELLTIPPSKVRFNANSGGILHRNILEAAGWPGLEFSDYFQGLVYKFRLYGGDAGVYLIPSGRHSTKRMQDELAELRRRGLVE